MVGEVLKCQKQKSILKMRVRVPKIFKTEINTENECVWGGGGDSLKSSKQKYILKMGGESLKSPKQKYILKWEEYP